MIDMFKVKEKYWIDIESYLHDKVIGIDLSFQSKARWSEEDKEELFMSAMDGDILSPHIIVNLETALATAKKSSSIKLYKKHLDRGCTHLSIDSNNRNNTYKEILDDKVYLQPGTYYDMNENSYEVKEKTLFSNLPKALQKKFLNNSISIIEYTTIERRQCKILFKRVNKGVNLNRQELRNAEATDIAEFIRDFAVQYEEVFSYFVTEGKLNRRWNDHLVAECVALRHYGNEKNPTNKVLDLMYDGDSVEGKFIALSWDKTYNVINSLMKILKTQKDSITDNFNNQKSWFIDLFNLMCHLEDNHIKINDDKKFLKWFLESHNKRIGDVTVLLKRKNANGEFNETFSTLSGSQKDFCLEIRNDVVLSNFYNDSKLIEKNIVNEVPSDDYFTYADKFVMWKRQNGFAYDAKTNKPTDVEIPLVELYNSKKWQADAIIPRRGGGYHTLDNGQLTSAKDNQSANAKGTK